MGVPQANPDLAALRSGVPEDETSPRLPFADFAPAISPASELRRHITAAYRRAEPECVPALIAAASLPAEVSAAASNTARKLVEALRAKHGGTILDGLIHEYALSSQEGVALMCLAEALLRVPDNATRDALIRDKIAAGDWRSHLGKGRSLFVNAATWSLIITGKLTSTVNEGGLSVALNRLIGRYGEPVIRKGVDMAMRMMGEKFVTGETIDEALANSRRMKAKGFRYSFDMLGEGAVTAGDAKRYYALYENAIHAVGRASAGRGVYDGDGISIKLSALHPRYSRAQAGRVMGELLPQLKTLATRARRYDIGLNIDAEEADRLEISLDLLEALCHDPDLAGWNGLGFVVQAYGKRCPFVIDSLIDLARRSGHRIMVRLVKGAYWDSEIKKAQVDGLESFPVYTRKLYTDVSYIACAKKLLEAGDLVFPQFATHNAHTLATIHAMAGKDFKLGQYEFQCLHGMGEPLYEEVVGPSKLDRPCRIYAPVGTHETLLAYLVRRLLENGANSSFVHRIADPKVPVAALIEDPVEAVRRMEVVGAPNPAIALPRELYAPYRRNSAGIDLTNEAELARLSAVLAESGKAEWTAAPMLVGEEVRDSFRPMVNPADYSDIVGRASDASEAQVNAAVKDAALAASRWSSIPVIDRAACLSRAADLMQARMPELLGLIVREAGKSLPNAISEVREAIDFLRYYAFEARRTFSGNEQALGPVACISPWNFPLAIFTGQIAAALVAGNPVLAKPAEETPLIAAEGVRILHEAGISADVLQFLPGDGSVGAALAGHDAICGVMFTGSTEVARLIQRQLAKRLLPSGQPIPLIAETGGQNAMIVDSSALAEQVAADVLASAFDSAGQRCSALRVLCLQEEIAERTLTMLKGAVQELAIGRPDRLAVDIGPVISAEAKQSIESHISAMHAKGRPVYEATLSAETERGTFVPPTIIEIESLAELKREVFGPVLHVVRYRREGLDQLIDDINGTGYGLTFGLHTRLDEMIEHVRRRVRVGNIYVNRNMIGAVVGVQPFGGRGLSGTGPKAGGPLYLRRLVANPLASNSELAAAGARRPLLEFVEWLKARGHSAEVAHCLGYAARSYVGTEIELPGPVGERNVYALHPRGRVLLVPETETGLFLQIGAALATSNEMLIDPAEWVEEALRDLPSAVAVRIKIDRDWSAAGPLAAALVEGNEDRVRELNQRISELEGPLLLTQGATPAALKSGAQDYCLDWLVEEISTSINTAAAGGNASLLAIS